MKTKKSEGTKFLEKFINWREKDPSSWRIEVEEYLKKLGVIVESKRACPRSLLISFFGYEAYILHLKHSKKLTKNLLIGKGVCYDTGGYNLKTHMTNMHFDRNGALLAIAAGIDTKTDVAVFFVSNMLRDNSPVDGDILLEPFTNKKILISNTDAEGRIGLADLLGRFNKQYKDVLTIATLTGAAVGVTGERTMALVHSNKPSDYAKLMQLALSGNEIWPAPFHKDYDASIITKVKGADIDHCGNYRYAGSSTAFSFLKHFWKGHQLHLDIAAMDSDKNNNGYIWGIKEVTNLLKVL
jgi:leucyl aminopeptidase